ncbi:hypothetical protein BT69DRAFT_1299753 [Atractiella rhizophila]|nr:hypothetical protein BT69DRAFT_1299753 [Atractiella rhizophila]
MSDQENRPQRKDYRELYRALKRQRNDAHRELMLLQEAVARAEENEQTWGEERAQMQEELEAVTESSFIQMNLPLKDPKFKFIVLARLRCSSTILGQHILRVSLPNDQTPQNIHKMRNQMWYLMMMKVERKKIVKREEIGSEGIKNTSFRLKLFNGTAVPGSRVKYLLSLNVQRGLAEQKSDNAIRMRNNLVDIFEIKSSTSAELKIQKNHQEDEEIQRHINHESYIYAAYEVPARGTSSHQKAIKAAAYLRSPALFRIARIIVHGPATITSVNLHACGATMGSNLSIHQITIPLMAYSSTLKARYALSGDVAFSAEGTVPIKRGTTEVNDYRQHFERTVKLLSTIRAQHEDKFTDLISIWNKEVFPQDNAERDSSTPHHGTSDADILEGFEVDFNPEEEEVEE